MTDKVQKIREEVARIQLYTQSEVLKQVLDYIDKVQKDEPVSEDLEEAARKVGQKYFPDEENIWARQNHEARKAEYAFIEGANWQKEQDQSTIELARDIRYKENVEVKEVDINKEISQFIDANFENATIGHKLSLRRVAKHFFELGLKTKGE